LPAFSGSVSNGSYRTVFRSVFKTAGHEQGNHQSLRLFSMRDLRIKAIVMLLANISGWQEERAEK